MSRRSWACGGVLLAVLSCVPARATAETPSFSSGGAVLAEMGKQLEDPSRPATERLQIIRAFEEWATEQVRPPLVAVLKDPLPQIRAAAARALGWSGNHEAVHALRERVETPGEAAVVRAAAVRSLGRIGDPSVRTLVIAATGDPDASVRGAALWSVALGSLSDPADRTSYLLQLATDRAVEAQVRADAIRAVASVREERVVQTLARIVESEPRLTIPEPSGPSSPEQTMTLRYAQARDVVGWAAGALGQLEARTELSLLLTTAEDPNDFFLRQMSIQSLVAWNVPEAFPVLLRRLEDPLVQIRVLALMGVARLGDRKAVDPVLTRLSDESPAVRAQAVATLAALGDPKVRPHLEALQRKESEPDVLGALETALSHLPR